jgi:hypothetical protein
MIALGIIGMSAACLNRNDRTAVEQAIGNHLKQRSGLMLENMTMETQTVTFHDDTAQARVRFFSKQQPQASVVVLYELRRSGGHWTVQSSRTTEMNGTPHGNAGEPVSPDNRTSIPPPPSLEPRASH